MKRFLILLAICMIGIFSPMAHAANIKDYPTVAVMNFGNKAVMSQGLRDTDFSAATEYAIYQLSACGWFDLVDYEQLSTIAKIHSVNMSGLVDPSTAVAVGKFAGAQFMVVGNLTGLTTKEGELGLHLGRKGSATGQKHTVIANVAMRIVDIETGRIIVSGLGKGESASTHAEIVFKKYRNRKNVEEHISRTDNNTQTVRGSNDRNNTQTTTGSGYGDTETYSGDEYIEPYGRNDSSYNETSTNTSSASAEITATQTIQHDTIITTVREEEDYKIVIGTVEISDVQARNAISKAVRDCIYGNMGLMTTLNNGKKLNIKTGF